MRKRAAFYSRPKPFGYIGEVMGALLDHVEAVEVWEVERKKDRGAIRESLAWQTAAHFKALETLA